jgi:flagellar motor switch protein FliG
MKVSIKQTADDGFVLSFDDTQIAATSADLKALLLVVSEVLTPAPDQEKVDPARRFIDQIKTANDAGIQMLLRAADEDDLLVLLKHAESDAVLLEKFYGNMSERSHKIFAEDLSFKFKDKVTPAQVSAAVERLIIAARTLEENGTLVFGAD